MTKKLQKPEFTDIRITSDGFFHDTMITDKDGRLLSVTEGTIYIKPGRYITAELIVVKTRLDMRFKKGKVKITEIEPWISVKDRLPEMGQPVLAHFGYSTIREGYYERGKIYVGCFVEVDGIHFSVGNIGNIDGIEPLFELKEIIAWMPLPKPYKQDKKSK